MENPGTPDPGDATQRMPPPPTPPPPGYGAPPVMGWPPGARLPIPGNAEWLMWLFVEILFLIIWAASDSVGAELFVTATTVITFGYLISRGIAKASRVLEH
jgi:uncharacterized protein YraI